MAASALQSPVYTLQFNRHRQTAETIPVLTSNYTVPPIVLTIGNFYVIWIIIYWTNRDPELH